MKILRDTVFEVGHVLSQLRPPRDTMTVVVKGTFAFQSDATCTLAETQALITGDEFVDDDPDREVRYSTDMAPIKPHGECFLIATCHPPGGSATHSAVSFQLGAVKKTFAVYGDRYWRSGLAGASEPAAFQEMPLVAERCFGGEGFGLNPYGRGIHGVKTEAGVRTLLPNIEDPGALIQSPADRPAPALSGPLHPNAKTRAAKLGTYDTAWLKTRWPWFPEDFDPTYFNAAAEDLQIRKYWRGDEELKLQNLVANQSKYTTRLPGLRARCFLEKVATTELHEVPLQLDSVTVDADKALVFCVWRGATEVASDRLEDVRTLFVVHEPLTEAQKPEHYRDWFERCKGAEDHDDGVTEQGPISRAEALARAAVLDEVVRKRLKAAGLPINAESFNATVLEGTTDDSAADEMRPDPNVEGATRRAEVEARVRSGASLADMDLTFADLSDLDLSNTDFSNAILDRARLTRARMDGATLRRATLTGTDLDGASFRNAKLQDADLTGSHGERVNFDGAVLDGATLTEVRLPDASFQSASCKRTDFARAQMPRSKFQAAGLQEADLSRAAIDDCDFSGAKLCEADLNRVKGTNVRMVECDLTKVRVTDGAELKRGVFVRAKAPQSLWTDAKLDESNFALSNLERADFGNASLVKAALSGCNLKCARFHRANLVGAQMVQSDAFEALFEGADLSHADVRGTNLHGAAFFRARTENMQTELAIVTATMLEQGR